jgi:putative sigma-54 modulation protein
MDLVIKSRNGKVSERQRAYIEEKLGKLERYLDQIHKVTVEVSEEQRRNEGLVHRAQVTLQGGGGVLLRADQRAPELYAAIDMVSDTLQRQITRFKDKHWRRKPRRAVEQPVIVETLGASADTVDEEEEVPQIVRTKEFAVKPMHSEEALEQMELLGHDFFVFRNAENNLVNVLYRRKDGNYGLIVAGEAER